MGLKMLQRVVSVSAPVAEAPMGVAVEVVPLEWAVSEVEGGGAQMGAWGRTALLFVGLHWRPRDRRSRRAYPQSPSCTRGRGGGLRLGADCLEYR